MVYTIKKKYCQKNKVMFAPITDKNQLILGPDGIVLLRIEGHTIINAFLKHEDRTDFPFGDRTQTDIDHFTEIFDYNKTFLDFSGDIYSFRISKRYFYRSDSGAMLLEEYIPNDATEDNSSTIVLTRDEAETKFDPANYDAMFLVNSYGMITCGHSKKDSLDFGHAVIPSIEQIVELDLRNRLWKYELFDRTMDDSHLFVPSKRCISDIRNLPLYTPALGRNFSHLLITFKDNQFSLEWFKLDFVSIDEYRLTSVIKTIDDPTIENIIKYCKNNDTFPASEPIPENWRVIEGNSKDNCQTHLKPDKSYTLKEKRNPKWK